MKRVLRLTESDIERITKKVLSDQDKMEPNKQAVIATEQLIKKIGEKFCVPVFQEGVRTIISCNDNTHYEIKQYRKFGQ